MAEPLRILIYGSCVSRDTVESMGDDAVVVDYVARQSLVSAVGRAWSGLGDLGLQSPFQTRSLAGDLAKDGLPRLRAAAPRSDLVLIDLVDERLGVHLHGDGRAATHSYELTKSSALSVVSSGSEFLGIGSHQHFEKWRRAVWHLRQVLEGEDLWDRTLVLAPRWAERDDLGQALPDWRSLSIAEVNHRYQRYFDYLESAGLPLATVPSADCLAQSDHKWGSQPYHYAPTVYDCLVQQVKRFDSANRKGGTHDD